MAGERQSAVRLFASDHPALAHTVRARLEKQRDDLISQVGTGYAQDWANYKYCVGTIQGLQDAIDICKQTESDMEKS